MADQHEHRNYYNNDKRIPSCTEIVKLLDKPELVKWANYMGFKRIDSKVYLEERAAFGTHCHELFELYFNPNTILYTKGEDNFLDRNHYEKQYPVGGQSYFTRDFVA